MQGTLKTSSDFRAGYIEVLQKFANALDEAIDIQQVEANPSDKQKESGNYRKAHIRLHGLDISIENPKGYIRSGVSKDGKKWSNKLAHHYGYIKGTEGRDKDHIDVFIGDRPSSRKVYVVNQVDDTRAFDEHKVMMGFETSIAARKGYLANYDKGWEGLGSIHEVDIDDFKIWLKFGNTKKEYKPSWWMDIDLKRQVIPGNLLIEDATHDSLWLKDRGDNPFALFFNKDPDAAEKATQEAREIVREFLKDIGSVTSKYSDVGFSDTASTDNLVAYIVACLRCGRRDVLEKAASIIAGYQDAMNKAASIAIGSQTYTEVPITSDRTEFQAALQPGDILLFKPSDRVEKPKTIIQKFISGQGVWGDIKKAFNQGSDWGHSGIYVGDGKIIHAYPKYQKGRTTDDPGQSKVRYHSLVTMMNNYKRDILVLRPNVSEQERLQAVERARSLKGMPYSVKDMILAGLAPGLAKGDLAKSKGAICSAVVSYAYPGIYFRGNQSDRVVRPSDLHNNDNVTEIEGFSMDEKTASEYSRGYIDLYSDFIKLAWQFAEGAEDLLKKGRTPQEWEAFKQSLENPAIRAKFNQRYAGSQNAAGKVLEKLLLEDGEEPSSAFRSAKSGFSDYTNERWQKYRSKWEPDDEARRAWKDDFAKQRAKWEAEDEARRAWKEGFDERYKAREKAWQEEYAKRQKARKAGFKRPSSGGGGAYPKKKATGGNGAAIAAGLSITALMALWALHNDKERREREASKAASLSFIIGYNEIVGDHHRRRKS